MTLAKATVADVKRPSRRCRRSWWLAGLLVSCLLPAAALGQAETLRLVERLTQDCRLAARAERLVARRVRRRLAWYGLRRHRLRPSVAIALPRRLFPVRPSADQDVLSRRGPPRRALY